MFRSSLVVPWGMFLFYLLNFHDNWSLNSETHARDAAAHTAGGRLLLLAAVFFFHPLAYDGGIC